MFTKTLTLALAAAALAREAVAANTHRHANHARGAHDHLHRKDNAVYRHTKTVVITDYVYVTVSPNEASSPQETQSVVKDVRPVEATPSTTSTSSARLSTPEASPSSIKQAVDEANAVATTLATVAASVPAVNPEVKKKASTTTTLAPVLAPASTFVASVASVATAAKTSSGSGSGSGGSAAGSTSSKRGLVYNNATLLSDFVDSGSLCTWAWNWDSSDYGELPAGLEFVPILWSTAPDHSDQWETNANAAIAAGAKYLMSFNECDKSDQCNTGAQQTKEDHIKWMNPFAGKAKIGSPAISNSNLANEGLEWLDQWLDFCGGPNGDCKFDFCNVHWYNVATAVDDFKSYLNSAHKKCGGKPVWLTEFAPSGSDDEINNFLDEVLPMMDDGELSFVERYSFFMVKDGSMVAQGKPSTYGAKFAYGS